MNNEIQKFLNKIYNDPQNISANLGELKRINVKSPSLNWALNGGIVPGRFYVLTGPEGSGKSMFSMSIVHDLLVNNPNSVTIWFDTERSFTNHWVNVFFKGNDIELSKHIVVRETQRPKDIFDYFANDLMDMVDNGFVINGCFVDSVQQIIGPKEDNKKTTEDFVMSDLASYLPGAIRMIVKPAREKEIPWFFISQVRDNMEAGKYTQREDKYSMSGGRAFKHGVDVVLLLEAAKGSKNSLFSDLRNINDDEIKVGHTIRCMVTKNRLGPSYRKAEFMFNYNEGIVNTYIEVAKLALNLNIVKVDGRSYYLDDEKIAIGLTDYTDKIRDNNELKEKILVKVDDTNKKQLINMKLDDNTDNIEESGNE